MGIRARSLSSVALFATVFMPSFALAGAEDQATSQIEEIIVTAQRREASLLATPLSLTVIGQPLLTDLAVRDIKDLQQVTPGLVVASTSNQTFTTARIRGVGTVGDNPGLESAVGVMIDGVYRPRNGAALGDLGEVERIEVLKGPQPILFGKNTSAGVINVVTASPSFVPRMEAEASLGEFGTRGGSLSLNTPLVDEVLAGRLYVARRQRDGLYSVKTGEGPRTETQDQTEDYDTVRGQLLWRVTPTLSARLAADWTERDEACCVGVQLITGGTAPLLAGLAPDGGVAATPRPWDRVAYSNRDTNTRIRDKGLALHVKADLGWAELNSTTAVRDWRGAISQDWDFSSADLAYRPDDGSWSNRFRTLSQELRLSGRYDRVDWQAGLFAANERLTRRDSLFYGADYETYMSRLLSRTEANPLGNPAHVSTLTGFAVGTSFVEGEGQLDRYWQSANSLAVFGQVDWHLSDQLTLAGGLRWTDETKSMRAEYENTDDGRACAAALTNGVRNGTLCLPWSNPAFNGLSQSDEVSDRAFTGLVRAQYQLDEGTRLYASWSRGRKNGGFNLDRGQTDLVPDASRAFGSEQVESWEAGVKSLMLDRRLLIGASAFRQTYEDFQLNTFLGTTFLVRSVPEVRAKGVEIETLYRPFEGLSLQGGVTYAQSEYGAEPVEGLPLLATRRMAFAPLWSGTLAGSYVRPLGQGLTGRVTLGARFTSEYNTGSDLDPLKSQPGFWLVDGRVAVARDEAWSIELWGRNLLDQDYRQVAFGAPFQAGTLGAFLGQPRMLGVTLRLVR
jgi:iron complex outermembrane receptor protein